MGPSNLGSQGTGLPASCPPTAHERCCLSEKVLDWEWETTFDIRDGLFDGSGHYL